MFGSCSNHVRIILESVTTICGACANTYFRSMIYRSASPFNHAALCVRCSVVTFSMSLRS